MPIQIQQLDHTYLPGSQLAYPALSGISLTIQDGEFLGIIGHTGSGKSTLIQHLNGLLLPTSGSVLVDGLDTREKKLRKQIRSLVGMVFQYPEYQLFEETVARDVAFGPKNMGMPEAEIETHVTEALRLVGLNPDEFAEKSPFELSGGEKRRAALAGILAIELFVTKDERVIVNELAPRPHNSGHYTIEACSFDQFDAHIRGIAGWPLEQPELLKPAVMVNVLGQHVAPTRALIAEHPEWSMHDYCKAEVRHDRKMGHITVLTNDTEQTVADLERTGCWDDLK